MFRDLKRLKKDSPSTVKPTQFLQAAEQGDLSTVASYILARGTDAADMNVSLKDGSTALILAARKGHADIVDALLNVPVTNINAEDIHHESAFNYAAYAGNIDIAINILAAGCHINYRKDVLKIIEEKNHLQLLAIINGADARQECLSELLNDTLIKLSRATLREILTISEVQFRLFIELAHYEKLAGMIQHDYPASALTRVKQKFHKVAESEVKETRGDASGSIKYCFEVMRQNGVSKFSLNRNDFTNSKHIGNNGSINEITLTSEDNSQPYAVKWVRSAKLARHEAKFYNAVSSSQQAFWFTSKINGQRTAVIYPWQTGSDLNKTSNREIMNLSLLNRLSMLIMILKQLNRMHQDLYVHNDLRLANVVIDTVRISAAIIDFGKSARMNSRVGFNDDMIGVYKIIQKLFPDLPGDKHPIKIAMKTLMNALKSSPICTSEQSLHFCEAIFTQHHQLSDKKINKLAEDTINRNYLTHEDVLRGRYLD